MGINFGAPGDRYDAEDGVLWTHHPYAGNYGRISKTPVVTPEALPLVPVSYRGAVRSVYHHSAQMVRTAARDYHWVSPSQVLGMTGLTVHLAQPVVAQRTAAAPKPDGNLDKDCWKQQKQLIFAVNKACIDREKETGQPKADEHGYVMVCYDDTNLYIAGGVHVGQRQWSHDEQDRYRNMKVTLNNRERVDEDVVLTGSLRRDAQKPECSAKGLGASAGAWSCATSTTGSDPFTAEMAIPWKTLAAAGLWKDQLLINVSVAGSPLTEQYTPLYLDSARGAFTESHPHTVRLYFTEMEGKTPGQRVFDVSLQGKTVLENLDVVKEAGGPKRELVKEFKAIGISGDLDIGFVPHAGEAMLSGVEIIGDYTPADHAPHTAPSAAIEASTLTGPAPLEVTFSARNSTAPDGQIVECAWETGDGRLARGSVLRHVFAEPGTYNVHLLVRDNCGALSTASSTVTVQAGVPAAFVSTIRVKGGDYTTLSAWEAAMRGDLTSTALLFKVSARTDTPADDETEVKFTGDGTGTLKHINGLDIAYIVKCSGSILPGPVKCSSGHTFNIEDKGYPVYSLVAECYNDWTSGLADKVVASTDGAAWKTDALRCLTIRTAAGKGHHGVVKNANGQCDGFTLKGDLDLSAIPYTRICNIIVAPEFTLSTGAGASVLRVMAGTVLLREDGMAANSVASNFVAGNTSNTASQHISFYNMNRGSAQPPPANLLNPGRPRSISFVNCTGATFDPGNQPDVAFINCLAAPGGKGFYDARYADGAYANHCVSSDGSAAIWDSGDGNEGNVPNQTVSFVNAAGGDYRLLDTDKGARGLGAPGLGADAAGADRLGPSYDVGALTFDPNVSRSSVQVSSPVQTPTSVASVPAPSAVAPNSPAPTTTAVPPPSNDLGTIVTPLKTYQNCHLLHVKANSIVVKHADGLTELKFADLQSELQKRFGYDPQLNTNLTPEQVQAAELQRQAAKN